MHISMKLDEGNDSLDTFIRQAIAKDPLVPFSRIGDSSVQWIQLLSALDQPDIPGWPLLTPVKVQMQKCDKCSREFCSPINYKRHIRVHRRSLNVNKESNKNRDLLASFWDKCSLEEANEIISLNDVMLKEIPGPSVLRALVSSLRKPAMWSLPQVYVKAGSALSDIIYVKPFVIPISSKELFRILDDASEGTFLCGGTAQSVQKYLFDGETSKNSLELKNLVACTSFLFEQQLVKAWIADKDAEALRCHKLLVEEEEAAQKRLAEILERKKQKKLRQKEQKVKEQSYGDTELMNVVFDAEDEPILATVSGHPSSSDSNSYSPDVDNTVDPCLDSFHHQSKQQDNDFVVQFDVGSEHIFESNYQVIDHPVLCENDFKPLAYNRWQVPKSHKTSHNGYRVRKNVQMLKHEPTWKLDVSKDESSVNGSKVWTKKFKGNKDGKSWKRTLQAEATRQVEEANCKVMIGSISVALEIRDSLGHGCIPDKAQEKSNFEHSMLGKINKPEKLVKADRIQSDTTQTEVETEKSDCSRNTTSCMIYNRSMYDDICTDSCSTAEGNYSDRGNFCANETCQEDNLSVSITQAKEFLSQRWKNAILADHMKLTLSSITNDHSNGSVPSQASDLREISILGNAEKHLGRKSRAKSMKKPEKNLKIKYMPKQ